MRTFTGGRRLLLYAKIFLKSTTWSAGGTITLSAQTLRSQLLAKNKRKSAPLGGKIDFDVDGTASGNWFLLGTNGYGGLTGEGGGNYWAGHLALARGNIDPALLVISMGFSNGSTLDLG